MNILGIESSCDETAAAVVTCDRKILSNVLRSQWEEVTRYGGVVPEVAARSHLACMDEVIDQAMTEAGLGFSQLDGIAVTAGPGLMGGLIVGVMTAKMIGACHDIPVRGVNHLEAHALTVRLTHGVSFPYLLLLLSGGHCQLLVVHDSHKYTLLGSTLDDAVGEVFDKTAKLLNLGFPGGPAIEKAATLGDPHRFSLPRPLLHRPGWDFSFSGLKTAVRHLVQKLGDEGAAPPVVSDICASFQEAVAQVLANRCAHGLVYCREKEIPLTTCVMAGGVASNIYLRQKISIICEEFGISLTCPPLSLCTDNGAMIAWAGVESFQRGEAGDLGFSPRPCWPLGSPL
jgi:N6-L-threonylcarbamoyladenine synthase